MDDRQERAARKGKRNDTWEETPDGEVLPPRRPVGSSPYLVELDPLADDRTLTPYGPRLHTLAHVRELAQLYAHEAVMGHVEAMRDTEINPVDRYRAREALLDRGFGKASQTIKMEDPLALENMTLKELDEHQAKLDRAIEEMTESKLKLVGHSKT